MNNNFYKPDIALPLTPFTFDYIYEIGDDIFYTEDVAAQDNVFVGRYILVKSTTNDIVYQKYVNDNGALDYREIARLDASALTERSQILEDLMSNIINFLGENGLVWEEF